MEMYKWSKAQSRFVHKTQCPYPDCGTMINPPSIEKKQIGLCKSCGRTFEWLVIQTEDGVPLPWPRRPNAMFCSYSGRRLIEYSSVEWNEHGGSSARSSCLNDLQGEIFGIPDRDTSFQLKPVWQTESLIKEDLRGQDKIKAINLVNGILMVTTEKGYISFIRGVDTDNYEIITEEIEAKNQKRESVSQTPVVRGPFCVVQKQTVANFYKIGFFSVEGTYEHSTIEAQSECSFYGPPLGIDLDTPAFVLWQAQVIGEFPIQSSFLVYTQSEDSITHLLFEIDAPNCARPPIYVEDLKALVWIDRAGNIFTISKESLLSGNPSSEKWEAVKPDTCSIQWDSKPTFVFGASDDSPQFFITNKNDDPFSVNGTILYKIIQDRHRLQWKPLDMGNIGEQIYALAVGVGSEYRGTDSLQDVVAIATDQSVVITDKNATNINPSFSPMPGAQLKGSIEPPVICGAGIVFRIAGRLRLSSFGFGWGSESDEVTLTVPYSMGLLMLGNRIFIGEEDGVAAYDITKI